MTTDSRDTGGNDTTDQVDAPLPAPSPRSELMVSSPMPTDAQAQAQLPAIPGGQAYPYPFPYPYPCVGPVTPFSGMPSDALPKIHYDEPPVGSDHWRRVKLWINCGSLVMSLVGLGLTIGIMAMATADSSLYFIATFPMALFTFHLVWLVPSFIAARVRERPLPPGFFLAMHLLTWLYGVFPTALNPLFSLDYIRPVDRGQYSRYDYFYGTRSQLYSLKVMIIIVILLSGFLSIASFFLFVRACVETKRLNQLSRTKVIYIVNGKPMIPYPYPTVAPPQGYAPPTFVNAANPASPFAPPPQAHYFQYPPQQHQQQQPQQPLMSADNDGNDNNPSAERVVYA